MASGFWPRMSVPRSLMLPVVGRDQAGDRAQRRALAGAVGAEQGDDLAFIDAEIDTFEDVAGVVAGLQ